LVTGPDGDNRLVARIDNTQAVAAINKGYSPSPRLDDRARAYGDLVWSIDFDAVVVKG
jgi:hypothetical protein